MCSHGGAKSSFDDTQFAQSIFAMKKLLNRCSVYAHVVRLAGPRSRSRPSPKLTLTARVPTVAESTDGMQAFELRRDCNRSAARCGARAIENVGLNQPNLRSRQVIGK